MDNIVGKGDVGYQHFLLFRHNVYKRLCSPERQKTSMCSKWLRIRLYFMFSGRISRNIGGNIFRSYTGTTSENIDFHVLVA